MKILIVDDEVAIRNVLKEYLELDDNKVYEANNGEEALEIINDKIIDIMILDIMMPKLDGLSMLLKMEKRIPTIILSARGDEIDKLNAFDIGIDDYVTKPFSPKEVVARCKALYKRLNGLNVDVYKYNKLEINYKAHVVKISDNIIKLTPKEYDILCYLVSNKGIAISREQLLSSVWGYDFYGDDRTVDTHIKMLRNSLADYRNLITTVRGVGYKYEEK